MERVFRRSEGNPLFVEAPARTRVEPDADTAAETPAPLRELLLTGAHRVDSPDRAAVAGTTVGHALLHTINAVDTATPTRIPGTAPPTSTTRCAP
ncbi:hypothetical protein [Embleya hyalina]|uniref:Uncharacterized protein n=1 Tax=Embleya hyalina TaxID=516124 RepID=A0A401YJF2_9ACTN|nr:hypothetical protein [Embleya hyalina]GCD94735.1 hypothetical protein EHYA_02404 [Embleya hyalina]